MVGSSLIALNVDLNRIGYFAFLISGVATLYLLNQCKASWSLKFIAWFYFLINIIGIIRY